MKHLRLLSLVALSAMTLAAQAQSAPAAKSKSMRTVILKKTITDISLAEQVNDGDTVFIYLPGLVNDGEIWAKERAPRRETEDKTIPIHHSDYNCRSFLIGPSAAGGSFTMSSHVGAPSLSNTAVDVTLVDLTAKGNGTYNNTEHKPGYLFKVKAIAGGYQFVSVCELNSAGQAIAAPSSASGVVAGAAATLSVEKVTGSLVSNTYLIKYANGSSVYYLTGKASNGGDIDGVEWSTASTASEANQWQFYKVTTVTKKYDFIEDKLANAANVTATQEYTGETPKTLAETSDPHMKKVYVYNPSTGLYLSRGGNWGTEAVLSEDAYPFELSYAEGSNASSANPQFSLKTTYKPTGSDGRIDINGPQTYLVPMLYGNPWDVFNSFLDVKAADANLGSDDGSGHHVANTGDHLERLTITPAALTGGDASAKMFTISVTLGGERRFAAVKKSGNQAGIRDIRIPQTTYYMSAAHMLESTSNTKQDSSYVTWIPRQGRNLLADSTHLWMLIPESQIVEKFNSADASSSEPVDAPFLVTDGDFARSDAAGVWYANSSSTFNATRNTNAADYATNPDFHITLGYGPKSANSSTYNAQELKNHFGQIAKTISQAMDDGATAMQYYLGNGYGDDNNNQWAYGGLWTGNMIGKNGRVRQTVIPSREGWYEVRCDAFSYSKPGTSGSTTPTAYLYASAAGASSATKMPVNYSESPIQKLTEQQFSSLQNSFHKAGSMVDSVNIIGGAEVGVYELYTRVYISSTTTGETTTLDSLTYGIKVYGDDVSWVCFDDFHVKYLGKAGGQILLDEDQTDATYINLEQCYTNNSYSEDNAYSTVYLRRTLNTNCWNTIVLPFDMSETQIQVTFGSETKVCKFSGAEDTDEKTSLSRMVFFDQVRKIEKDQLYIINPSNPNYSDLSNVETTVTSAAIDVEHNANRITFYGGQCEEVKNGTQKMTDHVIAIPRVVFYRASGDGSGNTTDYYTTSPVISGTAQPNTYHGQHETDTKNRSLYFRGTWVMKKAVKREDGTYDPDQGIPANSFALAGKTTQNIDNDHVGYWYYRTIPTTTRGFRGWIEAGDEITTDAKALSDVKIFVDGVEEQNNESINKAVTTMIAAPAVDAEVGSGTTVGVYNLQGQRVSEGNSLEGLKPGIYIVGGHKVLVK